MENQKFEMDDNSMVHVTGGDAFGSGLEGDAGIAETLGTSEKTSVVKNEIIENETMLIIPMM